MLTSQRVNVKTSLVSICVALGLGLFSSRALAFEDLWHVGGGLGAVNTSASAIRLGPALNGYVAYGLSDMFDLELDVAASIHTVELTPGSETTQGIYTTTVGASYKIDVGDWIPYLGGHVGGIYANLPSDAGLDARGLLVGGALGLDYFAGPQWGIGLTNRWHWLLDGGSLVDLFVRVEYRWQS